MEKMARPGISPRRFLGQVLSLSSRSSPSTTCLRYSHCAANPPCRRIQTPNFSVLAEQSTYLPNRRLASNKFYNISNTSNIFNNSTITNTFRRQFSYTHSRGDKYRRFGQQQQNGGYQYKFRSDFMQGRMDRARQILSSRFVLVIVGGGALFYVFNLETVEATGRRRFNVISAETENSFGEQNYEQVLEQYRGQVLPDHHPYAKFVKRVMDRLIPHVKLEGADWKIHVINDQEEKNAFVLPSGKVFVFTGIFPIAQDEDGLAAVLGHEIAHVVAHHPAERMSSGFIVTAAVLLLTSLFDISGQLPSLLMSLLYSFPNSRTQEAEADRIGMMIMSESCFDPKAAIRIWQRFDQVDKEAPPQFISTHPSHYNRSQALREWLPEAESRLDASGCDSTGRYFEGFQNTYSNKADWI